MKYHTLEINGQELRCRLTTQNTRKLEEKLGGESLMLMLVKKKVLGVGDISAILHSSLQALEHGWTAQKVDNLIDEYIDNDGDLFTLQQECMNIMKVSGFFKESPQNQEQEVDKEEAKETMSLLLN